MNKFDTFYQRLIEDVSEKPVMTEVVKTTFIWRTWKTKDGKLHRLDGPAWEMIDKQTGNVIERHWRVNDLLHRTDGPAIEHFDKNGNVKYKAWYIKGIDYTEKEFEEFFKGLNSGTARQSKVDLWGMF